MQLPDIRSRNLAYAPSDPPPTEMIDYDDQPQVLFRAGQLSAEFGLMP
jgi:hypothetical protein